MEIFVKPLGTENKVVGSLKASTSGAFKSHKTKKINSQLEKVKSHFTEDDLKELYKFWNNLVQGGLGEYFLNNRPPDPKSVLIKTRDRDIGKSQEEGNMLKDLVSLEELNSPTDV